VLYFLQYSLQNFVCISPVTHTSHMSHPKVNASDYGMARPQVPDEGDGLYVRRVAGITLNLLSQLYNASPIYRLAFRLYTSFQL
jgi:hypothetical protein